MDEQRKKNRDNLIHKQVLLKKIKNKKKIKV
jgi:hypothetical protein